MSKIGYWKARPEAKAVYDERMRAETAKNFGILTGGLNFTATILGVFGVCLGNIELISAAVAVLMLEKAIR